MQFPPGNQTPDKKQTRVKDQSPKSKRNELLKTS